MPSVSLIICVCDGGIVSIRGGSGNDVISGGTAHDIIFGDSDQAASWNYRVGELGDITRSGDDGGAGNATPVAQTLAAFMAATGVISLSKI